jgi:paired amphipathic helix protein Sin3a
VPRSEFGIFERVFNQLNEEEFNNLMKLFYLYIEGIICQDELFLLAEDIFFSKVTDETRLYFQTLIKNRDVNRRMNSILCKATSELEYAKLVRHSYSYYSWSKFPVALCQGRDDLCTSVLNDEYISLPQGSDMFKFKMKNQYEDTLYQLEDTMTDHDFKIGN